MTITRRSFLRNSGAALIGFAGLKTFVTQTVYGSSLQAAGYGPLIPDPQRIFDLPQGFSYRVISRAGEPMSDGFVVPGLFDGMAAFRGPGGKTIIVRNHEITPEAKAFGPFKADNSLFSKIDRSKVYDAGQGTLPGLGGTTTLVYDAKSGKVEKQFLSLAGTHRNCAGGITPWNSWITCEETVARAGGPIEKDHGYNFDVPASAEIGLADPIPLKAMGRFNHEAVAVDERSGIVYQTEDRGDGLIYRFIPNQPRQLAAGGKLQALVVRDQKSLDSRNHDQQRVKPGDRFAVEWVNIEDVESPNDDLRLQGFNKGAARFARGEGMWYAKGIIYFVSTDGGPRRKGQVWKYTPSPAEGKPGESAKPGLLELFVEPNDGNLVENADNLCVAPWGDLYLSEDNASKDATPENALVVVTPKGQLFRFGKNAMNNSEVVGPTFSPDGSTLFVSIQNPGTLLAITGPWKKQLG